MTPNQPYLLRAYYEWIVDNDLTPHLVVDAELDGVDVPREHVKDGQIVLNVSPSACIDMQMGNEWVMFSARFGGVSRRLVFPTKAVLAIFARENRAGTIFMQQDSQQQGQQEAQPDGQQETQQATKQVENADANPATEQTAGSIKSVETTDSEVPSEPPRPPKGRPSLKVVK